MECSLCCTGSHVKQVPIDIDQWHDVFYRYKTPQLQLVYLTDYTVLKNIDVFCSHIKCNPAHLCKYLGKHLHTSTCIKKEQYKIRGHHSIEVVSPVLDEYIHRYILCKNCGLPELKGETCQSCGN